MENQEELVKRVVKIRECIQEVEAAERAEAEAERKWHDARAAAALSRERLVFAQDMLATFVAHGVH
jgi:hypothetical protein